MGYCIFLRKGEIHTPPSTGILASDLAVGDIVKLTENGTPVEYIVVNQGIPTGGKSLYDSSCNGTWLLRKDCLAIQYWGSTIYFSDSQVEPWLNDTFFGTLGSIEQATIKQVKIPYSTGYSAISNVASGANGLSCKIFFLSGVEMGGINSGFPTDGAQLSYFERGEGTTAQTKRKASYGSYGVEYYTRSTYVGSGPSYIIYITPGGAVVFGSVESNNELNPRPALILPFTAKFDKDTKILKG